MQAGRCSLLAYAQLTAVGGKTEWWTSKPLAARASTRGSDGSHGRACCSSRSYVPCQADKHDA